MLDRLKNYCLDQKFQIHYEKGKLDVINYLDVVSLEENRISLQYENGLFVVRGENLVVHKLFEQEILISGNIRTIEFG